MLRPHEFQPPEDGLPPEEVRVLSLRAEPWPDGGRRVRVHLEITPFKERPNLEVSIADINGVEVSSINIIESIDTRMTFTMHIRSKEVSGKYTLSASLAYDNLGKVDEKSVSFETHEETES